MVNTLIPSPIIALMFIPSFASEMSRMCHCSACFFYAILLCAFIHSFNQSNIDIRASRLYVSLYSFIFIYIKYGYGLLDWCASSALLELCAWTPVAQKLILHRSLAFAACPSHLFQKQNSYLLTAVIHSCSEILLGFVRFAIFTKSPVSYYTP